MLKKLLKSESGATAIEYGLIAALVSIVALPAMGAMGNQLDAQFSMVNNAISDAAIAGDSSGNGNNGNGLGNGNGNGNNGDGLGNGGAN